MGHIINNKLNDCDDIINRRNILLGQLMIYCVTSVNLILLLKLICCIATVVIYMVVKYGI